MWEVKKLILFCISLSLLKSHRNGSVLKICVWISVVRRKIYLKIHLLVVEILGKHPVLFFLGYPVRFISWYGKFAGYISRSFLLKQFEILCTVHRSICHSLILCHFATIYGYFEQLSKLFWFWKSHEGNWFFILTIIDFSKKIYDFHKWGRPWGYVILCTKLKIRKTYYWWKYGLLPKMQCEPSINVLYFLELLKMKKLKCLIFFLQFWASIQHFSSDLNSITLNFLT